MSPTTLYREGSDLDDLLAELDTRYPGQVRVVEVTHPREGGVLGFFAKQRVGVHYRLVNASSEPEAAVGDGAVGGGFVGDGSVRGESLRGGFVGDGIVGDANTPRRNDFGAAATAGVRDGFGPDREVLRAVLAKRAAAPSTGAPTAATATAAAAAAEAAIASGPAARVTPSAGPVSRSIASSAPFAQILADIALRKASGDAPAGPVSRAASTRAPANLAHPDSAAAAAEKASSGSAAGRPGTVLDAGPTAPPSAPAASAPFAEFVPLAVATASPEENQPPRRRKRAVPVFDAAATPLPGLVPADTLAPAGADSTEPTQTGAEPQQSVGAGASQPSSMSEALAAIIAAQGLPSAESRAAAPGIGRTDSNSGGIESALDPLTPVRPGALSWPLAAPAVPAPAAATTPAAATNVGVASAPASAVGLSIADPRTSEAGAIAASTDVDTHAGADTSDLEETTDADASHAGAIAAAYATSATLASASAPAAGNSGGNSGEATAARSAASTATATAEHHDATPSPTEQVSPRETSYSLRNHSVAGPSTPLTLRRQLLELGVPVDRVPNDAVHAYAAVEALVRGLAPTPQVPVGNGQILVVAGPARDVVAAADAVVAVNPGAFDAIWTHGCAAIPSTRRVSTIDRVITSPQHATKMAADARSSATGTTLIVVATDFAGSDSAEVVGAIRPDAVWSAVDATRKSADTRRALRAAGRTDAIVVANAEHSTSPATVWELDLPIALVDGRPSSEPGWAVLLLGKLSELEESACSTALC